MKRWLGRPYDPEAFSLERADRYLARIPWPRVSITQHGKILGAMYRAKG